MDWNRELAVSEPECECESVAADVVSAHRCELHGRHQAESIPWRISAVATPIVRKGPGIALIGNGLYVRTRGKR